MTLLAYTSDLHGNLNFYEAFLALARSRHAQAAILGGDLLPHTSSRQAAVANQRHFITTQLGPLLAYHRDAAGPPVYAIFGNDDWLAAVEALQELETEGLIHYLHMRVLSLGERFLAGYACVPLTPFAIKDWERPEDQGATPMYTFAHALQSETGTPSPISAREFRRRPTIGQELASLTAQSDAARTIYVCHSPPYDSGLDRTRAGKSVGSRDLRRFIETHQPPLTFHGHIHEAPQTGGRYAVQLGHTWSVNPGQGDRLHAVLCDPDDLPGSLWHTELGAYQT